MIILTVVDGIQNTEGLIYEFKAEDGDPGDNDRLIYSVEVLQGNEGHIEMAPKTGQLMAVQALDFESVEFYLLKIIVRVCQYHLFITSILYYLTWSDENQV